MSAFIVSNSHISAILFAVASADKYTKYTDEELTEIGQKLLVENVKSINDRYREKHENVEAFKLNPKYRQALVRSPIEALKLISCLEYQSCEHDGWETSEAKSYLAGFRHTLINALPGYGNAAWAIN